MSLDDLAAREAVRDLVARYTWAGDRGRSAELASLFLPEGVLDVGGPDGAWTGRERIEAELDAVAARVAGGAPAGPVRHHVSSLLIDLPGPGEARASSYFLVVTGAGPDHWGRYRDDVRLDPADGRWRFAHRLVRVDGWAPGSRFVGDTS